MINDQHGFFTFVVLNYFEFYFQVNHSVASCWQHYHGACNKQNMKLNQLRENGAINSVVLKSKVAEAVKGPVS